MTTLLDIGCNTLGGYEHLQRYEDITSDSVRKIFVEPNPECWSTLDQKLNGIKNVHIIKKAISKTGGDVELITRSDVNSDIAATILGKEYLEKSLAKCNMFVKDFSTYKIESLTLSKLIEDFEIIPEYTILKLDAEGIEYDILEEILNNNINFKKIYCEFHVHNSNDFDKKSLLLTKLANKGIVTIEWQ